MWGDERRQWIASSLLFSHLHSFRSENGIALVFRYIVSLINYIYLVRWGRTPSGKSLANFASKISSQFLCSKPKLRVSFAKRFNNGLSLSNSAIRRILLLFTFPESNCSEMLIACGSYGSSPNNNESANSSLERIIRLSFSTGLVAVG